jgi:hypothetical protein
METINTRTVLDRGIKYLGNHPDHLSKRIALALVLVDARHVRSVEAGILAFRMWALPEASKHTIEAILGLADEKTKKNE